MFVCYVFVILAVNTVKICKLRLNFVYAVKKVGIKSMLYNIKQYLCTSFSWY